MNAPHLIATFFGIGHFRPAPGTWGSLAALPLVWLAFWLGDQIGLGGLGGIAVLAAFTALAIGGGWWATAGYIKATGSHDPSEVVVDEVAGQFLTFLIAAPFIPSLSLDVFAAGFVLFRFFDILKMGPAKWADQKLPGAAGVMIDDLFAGAFAAIILILINRLM